MTRMMTVLLLALGGCATILDGSSQEVTLTSNAPGATCSIAQNGVEIAPATPVPATFDLARHEGNLLVTCEAPGYQSVSQALVSGKNPLTVSGHMWNWMPLALVDVFTGAVNEYQGTAYMHLPKV